MVHPANHVAFQAPDNVALGLALGGATGDVGDGRFVESDPHDHGAVDRGVELAVPTVVDPVPTGAHPGGRRDRTYAGQLRQRGLGHHHLGLDRPTSSTPPPRGSSGTTMNGSTRAWAFGRR